MSIAIKRSGKAKGPSVSPPAVSASPVERPDGMWERISRVAYELWEQRGRRDGDSLRDWLDAEAIVMDQIHEARE